MSSLLDFLEYWQREATVTDRDPDDDEAKCLYYAHVAAVSDLETTRAQTLKFLEPVKNSKGAWVPGFASDKVGEVVNLASVIAEKEQNLKSTRHGIEEFLSITNGEFVLKNVAARRTSARGAISMASRAAAAERQKAMLHNPGISLEELAKIPEVIEAEKAMKDAKAEFEPVVSEMTNKLSEIHGIIDKYDH